MVEYKACWPGARNSSQRVFISTKTLVLSALHYPGTTYCPMTCVECDNRYRKRGSIAMQGDETGKRMVGDPESQGDGVDVQTSYFSVIGDGWVPLIGGTVQKKGEKREWGG